MPRNDLLNYFSGLPPAQVESRDEEGQVLIQNARTMHTQETDDNPPPMTKEEKKKARLQQLQDRERREEDLVYNLRKLMAVPRQNGEPGYRPSAQERKLLKKYKDQDVSPIYKGTSLDKRLKAADEERRRISKEETEALERELQERAEARANTAQAARTTQPARRQSNPRPGNARRRVIQRTQSRSRTPTVPRGNGGGGDDDDDPEDGNGQPNRQRKNVPDYSRNVNSARFFANDEAVDNVWGYINLNGITYIFRGRKYTYGPNQLPSWRGSLYLSHNS
jgi:hypothetical protein